MATFIHEKNITVFPHDFDNQGSLNMVSNLVFIGNRDFHDTIVFNLLDSLDNCSLNILSQYHNKSRWLSRVFKGGLC